MAAELSDGSSFAGLTIDGILGRGGMGIVYKALQLELDRTVAVKVIAPEYAENAAFRERFRREARLAAAIDHPNVLPIYQAGEAEGRLFLVMRYVIGVDLHELIARRGSLDPAQAVSVAGEVAAALDAAHSRGLIHRDVKPSNVLMEAFEGGADRVYLTDFGLTRSMAVSAGLTATGVFVGTADYAAPEQINAQPLDARVDVYALGCVLYQALTGSIPFPRDSEVAKLYAHLSEPPPLPSSQVAGLPPMLDDVVVRALAKDREDRYMSAGDLARAAQAALRGAAPAVAERSVAIGPAAGSPVAQTQVAATAPALTVPTPAPFATVAAGAPLPRKAPRRLWVLLAGVTGLGAIAAVLLAAGVFSGEDAPDGGAVEDDDPAATQPKVVETIEVPGGPEYLEVNGNNVFISLSEDNEMVLVDAATNALSGEPIDVGGKPGAIAVDSGVAWVADSSGSSVRRIEAGTNLGAEVPVGNAPQGVSLGLQLVWVANSADNSVSRVDRAQATPVGSPIGVGEEPFDVFVGRSDVWITNRGDDTLSRINVSTATPVGSPIPVGRDPVGVAERGGMVWVANSGDDTVSRIDPTLGEAGEVVGQPIPVGSKPREIVILDGIVWVTLSGGNSVVRIDEESGQLVGSPISVGTDPTGIAAGDGSIWVSNTGDDTITRIDPG